MKLGEEKDGKRTDPENNRLEKIMSDYVRKHDFIHWRGIEFSLWKSGKRKEEIFPPSRGEAFLCKGVLILKKIRVLRETATFCAPGTPYVHRGRIPVKKKGTQWL
ncbi:MAG: hypothetical protein QCI38_06950, partial [Candidatus Thermoplasmatota archaeon]|nr:hypothetical protein [Candidatus Thermoplasmatota archaeon]